MEKFGLRWFIYSCRERWLALEEKGGGGGNLKLLIARVNGSQMMYFYANFCVCFGIYNCASRMTRIITGFY